ncbi:hypothetical protein [Pseudarthrobacter sulfonivorans]|uniref:hypothetical protein n=1 Tax=Pseudarthrobacter sulfonivorans TaxID=121292 RepID=UPI00285E1BC9|nr:hypothetical protein [Pseudarthrobacter sulfonivorans]MDR6417078.1 hypothetical protein [Pseudarthrobacter sulfonivorans]
MTAVESGPRRRRRRPVRRGPDTVPEGDVNGGPEYPAQDWSGIEVDTTVEVTPAEGLPYVARVDAKTPDSGFVWVVSLKGSGRQLVGSRDGVSLTLYS